MDGFPSSTRPSNPLSYTPTNIRPIEFEDENILRSLNRLFLTDPVYRPILGLILCCTLSLSINYAILLLVRAHVTTHIPFQYGDLCLASISGNQKLMYNYYLAGIILVTFGGLRYAVARTKTKSNVLKLVYLGV